MSLLSLFLLILALNQATLNADLKFWDKKNIQSKQMAYIIGGELTTWQITFLSFP